MRRFVSETNIGSNRKRHKTVIHDTVETTPHSQEACIRQNLMIQALADTPDLLNCGYLRPEKITLYHDGVRWVVEAEAEVETSA